MALPLREAFAAEHGPALRRPEGNRGLFSTLRAGGSSFNAGVMMSVPRRGGSRKHSHAFGLTGFAAFGLVLELLVVEEELFARGKNELGAAVDAGQNFVLKFH